LLLLLVLALVLTLALVLALVLVWRLRQRTSRQSTSRQHRCCGRWYSPRCPSAPAVAAPLRWVQTPAMAASRERDVSWAWVAPLCQLHQLVGVAVRWAELKRRQQFPLQLTWPLSVEMVPLREAPQRLVKWGRPSLVLP